MTGVGGCGKTRLALEVAHTCIQPSGNGAHRVFDACIGWNWRPWPIPTCYPKLWQPSSACARGLTGGAYVNMMMDEGQGRVQASYRDNYGRLVATKTKYDPPNLFHVNQNIRPACVAITSHGVPYGIDLRVAPARAIGQDRGDR